MLVQPYTILLPPGITSAQEVFQKRMSQHSGDPEGVETDIDDNCTR